jgi:hypothetical protein
MVTRALIRAYVSNKVVIFFERKVVAGTESHQQPSGIQRSREMKEPEARQEKEQVDTRWLYLDGPPRVHVGVKINSVYFSELQK